MFNVITNHYQAAIARLLFQYQSAANLQAFMAAIIQPIQDIEYVLNDMNVLRELANATGVQLDNIGTIVGLPRPAGATDDQYRNDLIGQIGINVSEGQPEQAIQTYQLFTGAPLVLLFEFFPAEVLIESQYVPADQAMVDYLLNLMQELLPAGVRCQGLVAFDPTAAFAYDGSLPGLGYGTASDSSVGGKYPELFLANTFFEYAGSDVTGNGYSSVADQLVGGEYVS